ncbi:MAG: helix-turn-helix domain-containing protein [Streptosporangiales bacterium]
MNGSKLLTPEAAAESLGADVVRPSTLKRMARAGVWPHHRVGNHNRIVFTDGDLDAIRALLVRPVKQIPDVSGDSNVRPIQPNAHTRRRTRPRPAQIRRA